VILFEDNVPSPAVARSATLELHRAAAAGHQPPLLVLVDQEGGRVRRLKQLPPTRSPPQIGVGKASRRVAETQGRITGLALRRLGINVDLAPVADVPASISSFLRKRAFSRSPDVVSRLACGFAAGLRKERVAATLKHFPGLGRASHNTDFAPVTVRASAAALAADLAPYARCARGVSLVMVSSASYPALDIRRPAVLVRRTYRLLALTGFRGLTISDAFDSPAIAAQRRPLLSAVNAGADLLLFGQNEGGGRRAFSRLVMGARSGQLSRVRLQRAAERILAFKRRLPGAPGPDPPTGR
jgi:beta-N-acetylhexosaminidase